MANAEAYEPQFTVDTMMSVLNDRLVAARLVEELAINDNKTLRVYEESDGSRFVRRDFTDEGVDYVENAGFDFQESLQAMIDLYSAVGIEVVPSFVFKREGETNPALTVISEYIPDLVDIKDLPTKEKVKLIQALGKLLDPDAGFWPTMEGIQADTFRGVKQEDGTYRVLAIDVDPLVKHASMFTRNEFVGDYIKRLSDLLWDDWCEEEERAEVAGALQRSLADCLAEEEYAGMHSYTNRAFMNLQLMSNGVDPRGTNSDMLADYYPYTEPKVS